MCQAIHIIKYEQYSPLAQRMSSRPSCTDFPIAANMSGPSINLLLVVSLSTFSIRRSNGLHARRRFLSPSQTKLQSNFNWFILSTELSKKADKSHRLARILILFRLRMMLNSLSASAFLCDSSSVKTFEMTQGFLGISWRFCAAWNAGS